MQNEDQDQNRTSTSTSFAPCFKASLTYAYILMELTLSKRLFRYALTFHAPPRVSDKMCIRDSPQGCHDIRVRR